MPIIDEIYVREADKETRVPIDSYNNKMIDEIIVDGVSYHFAEETFLEGSNSLTASDAINKPLIDYKIYGNSIQDGIPKPDAPVAVECVGDYDEQTGKYRIPIVVTGKNYFNVDAISTTTSLKQNNNKTITTSAFPAYTKETLAEICPFLKVGDVIVITMRTNGGSNALYLSGSKRGVVTGSKYTIKAEDLNNTIGFYAKRVDGEPVSTVIMNIQIELLEATTYEHFFAEESAIYLDEPLRKVGDKADYIDFKNGKVIRNIACFDISNHRVTFKYTWNGKAGVHCSNALVCNLSRAPGVSNVNSVFTVDSTADTCMWIGVNGSNSLYWTGILDYLGFVDDDTSNAITKFKRWLAENPCYVYYAKKEPTEETLSLPELTLHKGINTIKVNTAVEPSPFNAYYWKQIKP